MGDVVSDDVLQVVIAGLSMACGEIMGPAAMTLTIAHAGRARIPLRSAAPSLQPEEEPGYEQHR
jgi:hypothetical protein